MEKDVALFQEIKDRITDTTESFYQQNNQMAYQQLNGVLDQLPTLAQHMFTMDNISEQQRMAFMNYMREALDAMEGSDWILLADVLRYDINELLGEIVDVLSS